VTEPLVESPAGVAPSGTSTSAAVPWPGERVTLSGWGGSPRSTTRLVKPDHVGDLGLMERPPRFVARGLGRSYGDASQLAGGVVIDMTGVRGQDLDRTTGRVIAGGGASLGDTIALALAHGWFLPVTPGTRHVTVGGAIAADVHGKNHHRDGSFGAHVERLRLLTADGRDLDVKPGDRAFSATVGGMGLTGIILEATFRLRRVATSWMRVDTSRGDDLPAVMEHLVAADRHHRYTVAWLDLSPGRRGRGVVLAGDHAETGDLPSHRRRRPLKRTPMRELLTPPVRGPGLVGPLTVEMFNRLWFERAPRSETGKLQRLDPFFYPLDRLANWPRIYGSAGFLQYQFVVPSAAVDTLMAVAEILTRTHTPVSLAVLKRMGDGRGGPLSFPMAGWTLSADMPLGDPALATVLDGCDRLVAEAGGRVYLAKDARTRPELIPVMYPELGDWQEMRRWLNPAGQMRSDLSERLGITP
jgi:decaprenylphospho-beta-D-ribofuranose 2-oxidase